MATPAQAVALVNALSPPPSNVAPASIDAAVTGTYSSGIAVPAFTTCNARFASIVTTDATVLECGGNHTVTWGALVGLAASGTILKVDGVDRVAAEINALVTTADSSTGIELTGSVSEIFIQLRTATINGDGTILIDHTADSSTTVEYNIENMRFLDENETVVRYNDSVGTTATVFNISSVQSEPSASSTAGSKIFHIIDGDVAVTAGILSAETIAQVEDGATLSLDALVIFGDTLVSNGGIAVYESIGVITGDLDTTGSGALQVRATNVFGNVTTAGTGGVSVKCDQVIGDITIGSGTEAYLVIDNHVGTLTNNGTINGIVNGVYYGNWQKAGYILATWGANLQNTGRFPRINGTADALEVSGLGIDASAQVSAAGTIDTVTYYNATGDTTTQFKIIVNGQVEYTFTSTGLGFYGQEMGIGVPVVMNDNVAIEYDAGTAPGNGIYTMYIN